MNGVSTRPVIVRFHSPGSYVGTSPTWSTGNRSREVLAGRQPGRVVALLDEFLAIAIEEAHGHQSLSRRSYRYDK